MQEIGQFTLIYLLQEPHQSLLQEVEEEHKLHVVLLHLNQVLLLLHQALHQELGLQVEGGLMDSLHQELQPLQIFKLGPRGRGPQAQNWQATSTAVVTTETCQLKIGRFYVHFLNLFSTF